MSTLYNLEPNPTAKVILKTTTGDLLLELFAKQTPVTSRNFLQLCIDGYYDNTIFHRLVPDFIIQGGDPTGTGSGGQSSYEGGIPFADEFHTRLRFNRRGLIGMANSGTKDDNGSQFFLTLGKAEELNGKNTMFGRIEGNTIYNLVAMGEAELVEGDDSDRPLYPTRVTSTEILVNPFEDMVQRARIKQIEPSKTVDSKKKLKKKTAKQLLSFGVADDDDEVELTTVNVPKFNPKLVQASETAHRRPQSDADSTTVLRKHEALLRREPEPEHRNRFGAPPSDDTATVSESSPSPEPEVDRQATKLANTNVEIAKLKQSLKRDSFMPKPHEPKRQKTTLETMVPLGAKRGVKRSKLGGREEQRVLDAFTAFKSRLGTASSNDQPDSLASGLREGPNISKETTSGVASRATASEEEDVCDLHFVPNCQSCKRWEQADDEENEKELTAEGFMSHKLSFAKDRLGKSLEWKRQNEKELVVIDPRQREKEILGAKNSKSRKNRER